MCPVSSAPTPTTPGAFLIPRCQRSPTTCEAAWFGWPCDKEIEKVRQAFIRETDPAKQKQLAETLHKRLWEENIPVLPVGQYQQPFLWRKNITGIMKANTVVYWNIEKN